jgi:alkanesulfonate monooxygenase SsuD/methylene tetrahydromethanopterin reductase-like flavin-dependent oxidoreductase (luciferase family)
VPRTLTIGCTLPTSGAAADTGALRGLAQTAEAVGFDSIWLADHVVVPERIASSYPYSPDGRFPTTANQPYLEQCLRRFAEQVRPAIGGGVG